MANWPKLAEEQITAMEALWPPRCYDPKNETIEEHLKYAGKVEMVATLRGQFENERASTQAYHREPLRGATWEEET